MKGRKALARADLALPVREEIEALIGRGDLRPSRLRQIGLGRRRGRARYRRSAMRLAVDQCCIRRPAFDRGSHGHRRTCVIGNCLQFSALADLRKEMSTKSNGQCGRGGAARAALRDGTLPSDIGILQRARMELAYFSGYCGLKQRRTGGAGVILRFERVRPRRVRAVPAEPVAAKSRRNFSTGRSGR